MQYTKKNIEKITTINSARLTNDEYHSVKHTQKNPNLTINFFCFE